MRTHERRPEPAMRDHSRSEKGRGGGGGGVGWEKVLGGGTEK